MGMGTMTKGEKAVIYVTRPYLTKSTLVPSLEDYDELQFEVELIHFIQVIHPYLKSYLEMVINGL